MPQRPKTRWKAQKELVENSAPSITDAGNRLALACWQRWVKVKFAICEYRQGRRHHGNTATFHPTCCVKHDTLLVDYDSLHRRVEAHIQPLRHIIDQAHVTTRGHGVDRFSLGGIPMVDVNEVGGRTLYSFGH